MRSLWSTWSDVSCKVMTCHLPVICCSKASSFLPTGSRIPVVDAESPLHNRTGRNAFTGIVHVRRGRCFHPDASRNSAVAFSMSTICWSKISRSLSLAHEVKRSFPVESSSS